MVLQLTQRLQKLIYLYLSTDCFMKISLQSSVQRRLYLDLKEALESMLSIVELVITEIYIMSYLSRPIFKNRFYLSWNDKRPLMEVIKLLWCLF